MTAVATQAENPLTEGMERLPVHPTTLVIFGATGDLAKRKLLPAIYNLAHDGGLPERFFLIGVSRSDMPHGDYREMAIEAIRRFSRRTPDEDVLRNLLEEIRYIPGSFDDPKVYDALASTLQEFDQLAGHPLNRAFYLSTAALLLTGLLWQQRRASVHLTLMWIPWAFFNGDYSPNPDAWAVQCAGEIALADACQQHGKSTYALNLPSFTVWPMPGDPPGVLPTCKPQRR